jgi:methylmalonyl-CoA mutase cobalamin-binding domain/chain
MNHEDLQQRLIDDILAGDQQQAMALLGGQAAVLGWRDTIHEIIEPVLDEIGRRWEAEHISLAVGYMAGKIAEEALLLAARTDQAIPETKGPIVLGNVEDDFHSLGRKLVAIFLRTAGWKVIDLGNDILAEDFVEAAVSHNAKIIGVSAMMLTTAENIAKIRVELDRRGLSGSIKLAVGGAVFKLRPELIAEVGGDGTAASAVDAPKLMARLLGVEDGP